MNRNTDFITEEKKHWGKIYSDIMFAINEVSTFVDENKLNLRKYYSKSNVLKEYVKILETSEQDNNKKSFFSMFKQNSTIDLVKDYKRKNIDDLTCIENCSKCACLNCNFTCNFHSCSGCRSNSHVVYCDRETVNVRKFDNFTYDLTNNDTGKSSKYKVLAVIENCKINKQYILLQNIIDNNDKLILYYYPGIKDDDFGEINDIDEFNFVVETYQRI